MSEQALERLQDIIPQRPEGKCVVSLDQNQPIGDAMRVLLSGFVVGLPGGCVLAVLCGIFLCRIQPKPATTMQNAHALTVL